MKNLISINPIIDKHSKYVGVEIWYIENGVTYIRYGSKEDWFSIIDYFLRLK